MKKALFFTIAIVLLLSVFTSPAHAQDIVRWEPSNVGISDRRIFTLKSDPVDSTVIYAGTDKGIFKSTNTGESWFAINNGIVPQEIRAIGIDPNTPQTLIISTFFGVIYKTINAGLNWTKLYEIPESNNFFYSIVIDKINPLLVYAGAYEGFFKSVDGGVTWRKIDIKNYAEVSDVLISPNQNNTLLVATNEGIFKSIDYGETWTLKTSPIQIVESQAFAMDINNPSTIFVATMGKGVIKTIDGGETWETDSQSLPTSLVSTISFDSTYSKLYAGHWFNGVYMSDDGGLTWQEINDGLPTNSPSVLTQNPNNPGSMYAGTPVGVYKLVKFTMDKQLFFPLLIQ